MRKSLWMVILFFLVVLAGCGSSGSAQTSYISMPADSTPTPTPVEVTVTAHVVNDLLKNAPVAGVKVFSTGEAQTLSDENGKFSLTLVLLPGSETVITFEKDNYMIEDLPVSLSFEGIVAYEKTVLARLLLYKDVAYMPEKIAENLTGRMEYSVLSSDEKYLYVALLNDSQICRIDLSSGQQIVLAGDGTEGSKDGQGDKASFNCPCGIAISSDGNTLYVSEWYGCKIRKITNVKDVSQASAVTVSTIAGTGERGCVNGQGNAAKFSELGNLLLAPKDDMLPEEDTLYVCDVGNHCIRKVTGLTETSKPAEVEVSTLAGDGRGATINGKGENASFNAPYDLALSSDGKTLYVCEYYGNAVRKITDLQGAVKVVTIAGGATGDNDISEEPVSGQDAKFNGLYSIALCADNNTLFLSDSSNKKIKKVTGVKAAADSQVTRVSTVAGREVFGNDAYPTGLTLSADSSILYVCDYGNNELWRIIAQEK